MLGLGEITVRIAVEHHLSDTLHRDDLFGDQLGWIENVETERVGLAIAEELKAKFPFGKLSGFDALVEIAPMKIGVFPGDLLRFVPH